MANADRIIVLLHEAKSRPAGAERARFLDEACGNDSGLKEEIVSLLEADADEGDSDFPKNTLLLRPTAPVIEKPGDRIGRYKLLEQIGEGGCGVVYMAEQQEPVRRRVALKVIKLGMDTKQVIARFEAERQALAMMDHPNIAKVLEAGATDTGRPFFVMELVRGIRITDYCDQNNLSTRERLELFTQVCQAIQHAHQKGIIHRDIKPSNILVTHHDDVAVPKVIDFGISKATIGQLTDKTVFTAFAQFVGTPAYMSPEQAQLSGLDIDTRADIYSLGVLLYELLTGNTPFDAKELVAAGLDEMRRKIREDEPARPSTSLSTMTAIDLTTVARCRHVEPPKLIHLLRGDLDWLVMKCLEKDRTRRYQTANALAMDLQRHLNDEPIVARPPSRLYRFQKMIQRNRLAFAVAAVFAAGLVFAAVGSSIAAWRITLAQRAEHAERQKAEAANREVRDANIRLTDTVSLLELQRAEDFFRADDSVAGVAHLSAILRRNPSNHIAASRLVSALIDRNWALPSLLPIRHEERVVTVCFNPNGRHVLSASWDKTAQVHDAATGQLLATIHHQAAVLAANYDRAGNRFVTASADGTAAIWNATTGARLTPLLCHEGKVYSAEFSGDGKSVVTTSADHCARIWTAASGALKHELRDPVDEVLLAHFSPDSERVVIGTQSGAIRVCRVETGEIAFRLNAHRGRINALAFSPDGRTVASASEDGTVRLWDLTKGASVGVPLDLRPDVQRSVVFSPDGRLLLTASEDGKARLWNATNGSVPVYSFSHGAAVNFGAFSSDGRLVVTTSMDNSARLWHVLLGLPFCQPLRQNERIVHGSFDPDRSRLVTGSYDQIVQVWKIQYRGSRGMTVSHEKGITTIAFHPRGDSLLSASIDHTARLWNSRTGESLGQPMRHQDAVLSAEFSGDGGRIVTASEDGTANVWDSRDGRIIAGPLRHAQTVLSAQFSPNAERVVTASADGTALVWDARTGVPVTPPLKHGDIVRVARFSPDGRWIVTASENRSARVWNAVTGEPETGRLEHGDHVQWVEFSPDSQRVVSASSDNTARIWEVRTGKQIGISLQHARSVARVAFSPDGRRVVTASLDRTVRVWDAATGEAITQPLEHDGPVSHACFSPDGQRILTGSWNGTARLWDSTTGRPLTEWLDSGGPIPIVCFDSSGQRVATGALNGVRVWELPPVTTPVPGWFLTFAEAVAGTRLNAYGNAESVPRKDFDDLAQQVARNPGAGIYYRVGQWFLADPGHREKDLAGSAISEIRN